MRDTVLDRSTASLFSSTAFLDVIAQVYFPTQRSQVRDYAVDGQVFRLLTLDGRGPVVQQTFLDLHEPVRRASGPQRLPQLPRLQCVSLAPVPLDTFMANAELRAGLGAPHIQWSAFASWEDYVALLQERRFHAEDCRRARRLRSFLFAPTYCDDDPDPTALTQCMAWKSERDRSALRPDLFAVAANRQFFIEMRARGLLRVSTLRAGATLLAVWLGAVHNQRWSGWVFAFNPDERLRKYSLGRQLLYPMLESSFRAGHREFDFSIGMDPYKLDFATHVRPITSLGAAPARERLARAGLMLLRRHPWWAERARAMRGWLHAARG